jgi:hypothetical protein
VPSFGPTMACTKCETIGAGVTPNWKEKDRNKQGACNLD